LALAGSRRRAPGFFPRFAAFSPPFSKSLEIVFPFCNRAPLPSNRRNFPLHYPFSSLRSTKYFPFPPPVLSPPHPPCNGLLPSFDFPSFQRAKSHLPRNFFMSLASFALRHPQLYLAASVRSVPALFFLCPPCSFLSDSKTSVCTPRSPQDIGRPQIQIIFPSGLLFFDSFFQIVFVFWESSV